MLTPNRSDRTYHEVEIIRTINYHKLNINIDGNRITDAPETNLGLSAVNSALGAFVNKLEMTLFVNGAIANYRI